MTTYEVNFDCLAGPTHHFGGLSLGNLASYKNKSRSSNPRAAALQGLNKMKFLSDRGFKQAILPPHPRPHFLSLKKLGFNGNAQQICEKALKNIPALFSKLSSSSFMWAANAATFSPSIDSQDNKAHITPANLITMFHRSIEADFSQQLFQQIFSDKNKFVVHAPLPAHDIFSDEGAANHNRLCPNHGHKGIQIFVWSKVADSSSQKSKIFPARQSQLACDALARLHLLQQDFVIKLEQNPFAIDNGAFHNDVVAVTNESVFLLHEYAVLDQEQKLKQLLLHYETTYGKKICIIEVSNQELPIKDAVSSYLFNSQLLSKPDGNMLLFAPTDCQSNVHAKQAIKNIIDAKNPINECAFFDVSQSMANGGGPACLRLRIALRQDEINALHPGIIFNDRLCAQLE
ncbi:MAG: N-succinylarginine dihydrolase, partial [Myxococcales bacterium]|nr:N-succinylarginine dihydrolase [Myxococcales bacterium]